MRNLTVLGSTGSIGTQCLEILPKTDCSVFALCAGTNADLLEKQIRKFKPKYAALSNENVANQLKIAVADTETKVLCGTNGVLEIASMGADIVLNAIVGISGLKPTLCAIESGSDIALANKETLVTGGEIVNANAEKKGIKIFPVDSEHSAIFQCIDGKNTDELSKIIITASGGPFLGYRREKLENVKWQQALRHPNWDMGRKISIDSATLMNKGLEVIEAHHLFKLPLSKIDVVIHPQSIIHSLVEWKDRAVIAQLGMPDMKIPIQLALTYPKRVECDTPRLSLADIGTLTFSEPDRETFTCLSVCEKALEMGGLYPAAVNGAGELAVYLYLEDKISFLQIGDLVASVLSLDFKKDSFDVADIFDADKTAREYIKSQIK